MGALGPDVLTITALSLIGFAVVSLFLSVILTALETKPSREEFYVAHRAFERTARRVSPVADLARFMSEEPNGKAG